MASPNAFATIALLLSLNLVFFTTIVVGTLPKTPCCSLIAGLSDVDATVCLCTAIKAKVLGITLNVPVSLSLLLNYCAKSVPTDFQCT
ncbi:hypothetical protein L3X38_013052 [Prunus dulcis]|uniref:Hydrophobic seed protein domain-containing protein n=1 Tax=Prunus dulcis TaxID=3755 RepID=A0AAD4ZGM0_PRUDU|nr:hypothetical protein L3X38_013052 [Prunus dulcis]